jgi:hypothetical protein
MLSKFEVEGKPKRTGNYGKNKLTTPQWIERAEKKHPDKYSYHETVYLGPKLEVKIWCKKHQEFFYLVASYHLMGTRCPKCGKESFKEKKTTKKEVFIANAHQVHNFKYNYDLIKFVNMTTKIEIVCPEKRHKHFWQQPINHVSGSKNGCPTCAGCQRGDIENFENQAIELYNGRFKYIQDYQSRRTLVTIVCSEHGKTRLKAGYHLQGCGCPRCGFLKKYSRSAIEWLNFRSKEDKTDIQHAENGEEYEIPDTDYKADGYSKETNTIYEFLGDYWHANPDKYKNKWDKKHPTIKKTYKEVYERTQKKKDKIISLGYNYVEIWESDWLKQAKSMRTPKPKGRPKSTLKKKETKPRRKVDVCNVWLKSCRYME